jgi:hypothetical protein
MPEKRQIMPRIALILTAIVSFAGLLPITDAWGDAPRTALIIGNATYGSLPPIPGCRKSANTIAAALRSLGFQITERQDASTGGVDAGIGEFADHLAAGAGTGFVYICGYATEFNDRIFVLPTTARIDRPSDVLTQGTLAKAMFGPMNRDPATAGVVVFDLVPKPDGPQKAGVDALAALPVPEGVGIIAATEAASADTPTPLATAVVAALTGPQVRTEALLAAVRSKIPGNGLAIHMPVHPGFLAGAPAPAPPPPPAAPPPVVSAPPAVVSAPPVASPAAAPSVKLPDEASMTDAQRRQVQTALAHLGYYGIQVDGVFGPETRAAIRRYQHEIGSETTGRITADEATRLVNSR